MRCITEYGHSTIRLGITAAAIAPLDAATAIEHRDQWAKHPGITALREVIPCCEQTVAMTVFQLLD